MAITRFPKRKRAAAAAARERCNSCTSNESKIHRGSSKQQAMGILKRLSPGPSYDYSKCMIRDRPLLREQQCKEMIRSMGLEQFICHTEIPKLNRKLCDEFIASYDIERGCGVVQESITIFVDAEAVAKVTGLPLGQKAWDTDAESLKKLIPSLKCTHRGCCLRELVYGSRSKHFVAIAEMLLEKMFCKTCFVQYASPGLIVGMDRALKEDVEMQWAEFMAEEMRSSIKSTHSTKARFAHGEWLSGIIQDEAAVFSFDDEQEQLMDGSDPWKSTTVGDCSELNFSTMQVFKELAAFKAEFEDMMREAQQESVELKKELQVKEAECDALRLSQCKLSATKTELSAALKEAQKMQSATKTELDQLRKDHAEQLAKITEEHSLEVAKLKQEVSEQETDLLNFMNDPLKAFGAYTFLKKTHRKLKEDKMS